MKKFASLVIAFIIVSAAVAAVTYGIGCIFDIPYLRSATGAIGLGLCSGLGGTLGPMISSAISGKINKKEG